MNVRSEESRARLHLWWTRLATMTAKELIQFGRDTLLLIAIVYLFVFDTYMAGNVSMQLHHAVIVVHDADHSAASRELVYRFRQPYFKFGGEVLAVTGRAAISAGQNFSAIGQCCHHVLNTLGDYPGEFFSGSLFGSHAFIKLLSDACDQVHGDCSRLIIGKLTPLL